VRYRKYGKEAFHPDFLCGPGEVLAGGAAVKKVSHENNQVDEAAVIALVGSKRE